MVKNIFAHTAPGLAPEYVSVNAEDDGVSITVGPSDEVRPTYFEKHFAADPADDSYVEVYPDFTASVTITHEQARELANKLAHHLVTR